MIIVLYFYLCELDINGDVGNVMVLVIWVWWCGILLWVFDYYVGVEFFEMVYVVYVGSGFVFV